MKPFSVFLLALVFFANPAFAAPGFLCPKLKIEINKAFVGENLSTIEIVYADGRRDMNILLETPEGHETDAYQTRFGIYNSLRADAVAHFPYMPEFMIVYHMMKSQSAYLKGFHALDGDGKPPVKLGSMYCKALVEAILGFQP